MPSLPIAPEPAAAQERSDGSTHHVVEWQVTDVHDWIASLTFLTHAAEVANKAEAACISGELLVCLDDATLEELGVASALERLRLKKRECQPAP